MEGLWFPAFKMGDDVTEGSVLGRITDPLGNLLSLVKSPATGRVIFGEVGLPVIEGAILAGIARQVNKP